MRTRILLVVLLGAAMAGLAAQKMEPLNVKLGLWEVSSTSTNSGQLAIPAEMLARLTPEQRAKLEERMKAQTAGQSKSQTYKSCLTKEKMDKPFSDDQKKCRYTVITSTSGKISLNAECMIQDVKANGTVEFEAISPEMVKGSSHMTWDSGGHTMNADATYAGRWTASACGDVK